MTGKNKSKGGRFLYLYGIVEKCGGITKITEIINESQYVKRNVHPALTIWWFLKPNKFTRNDAMIALMEYCDNNGIKYSHVDFIGVKTFIPYGQKDMTGNERYNHATEKPTGSTEPGGDAPAKSDLEIS